ncbi:hypothetical protein [Haloarcula rubripromontorii]|uniref:hypothetical protein n=1 Tax=Haloarcula rubripromontorii TaxID=1705562 RepID=UPI00345C3CE2
MTTDRRPDKIELDELDQQLADADNGNVSTLTQAVATYETQLASAHEEGESDRYRGISRTYREQLITVLDEAIQTEGWPFLEEFLDAYHPETTDGFPHVTTILQNVTGRYLIRTRLTDGVDTVPAPALAFFSSVLDQMEGDGYDFIREGLHPYGWGIGHPGHSVADNIRQHASEGLPLVNAILEHAFYADQHSAVELLEQLVNDESVQQTLPYRSGDISGPRYLLDAPAGAVSDFTPTIPRYWEWQKEFDYEFVLDEDVEQRIRDIVADKGIGDNLPTDWTVADLTL